MKGIGMFFLGFVFALLMTFSNQTVDDQYWNDGVADRINIPSQPASYRTMESRFEVGQLVRPTLDYYKTAIQADIYSRDDDSGRVISIMPTLYGHVVKTSAGILANEYWLENVPGKRKK